MKDPHQQASSASHNHEGHTTCHCCPDSSWHHELNVSRRGFLTTAAVGGAVLSGLSWAGIAAAKETDVPMPTGRTALKVQPILVWDHPQRKEMWSWRSWGGIETPAQAAEEVSRIKKELEGIRKAADFPVEFAEVISVNNITSVDPAVVKPADVVIVYGAGGAVNGCQNFEKDLILFQRHRSGPLYLQYEIISPRFLRQHTDQLAHEKRITNEDVVTDSMEEVTWRLRALCGLKNTLSTKILCVGGPGGWAQPPGVIPELVHKVWNLDMPTVTYEDLGKLIQQARADASTMALAKKRAADYVKLPGTSLETDMKCVENCFLLDQVFRGLMQEADCRCITINGCMGTIMPLAETSACLTLSTLNDDGYLAFCESDFVVIPAGILMANIAGHPVFLNDPTYPHHGVITLAHCTGPRKMDGKKLEATRLVTHYESDFGAAPKVEMPKGQLLTNIAPDFKSERWMGLLGKIADAPFLPICRDQIDVAYDVPDQLVADRMPGFHWMTAYGDHTRELGYALRRVGIEWDLLNNVPTA